MKFSTSISMISMSILKSAEPLMAPFSQFFQLLSIKGYSDCCKTHRKIHLPPRYISLVVISHFDAKSLPY